MKVKNKKQESSPTLKGTVMCALGDRGVSLFVGKVTGKKVTPLFDHNGKAGDFDAVLTGEAVVPWVNSPTGKAVHAWVSFARAPVTIGSLAHLLKTGLVKKAVVKGQNVIVPAGWDPAQKVPQYVGSIAKLPLGRLESKMVRNADKTLRNGKVLWGKTD